MMKKIRRNDLCPCGSGKKYKNCCLRKDQRRRLVPIESFKVTPKKKPEIVDYHLVSRNAGRTWEKKPGLLLARIDVRPTKTANKEIDELFRNIYRDGFAFTRELNLCQHKLYAVMYHINNFVSEEQSQVQKFKEDYTPPSGVQMHTENPVLIYEMESFLFQVKSSLDVLTISLLNKLFGLNLRSFGTDIVIDALEKNENKIGRPKVNKLKSIIEKNKDWIEELNEMRVQVTHYSDLEGFLCFLAMPFKGEEECSIYYPSMPDGTRAKEYMDSVWKKLLSFYKSSLIVVTSPIDQLYRT
jgi:hypothetical protein